MCKGISNPIPARLLCPALLGLAVGLCACSNGPNGQGRLNGGTIPADLRLPDAQAVVDSFAPVGLRIHPLSRIEPDAPGGPRLVVCAELLDSSGLGVNWPGAVGIVAGSGPGAFSGWLDITTPLANAMLYDSLTRTYVLSISAGAQAQANLDSQPGQRLSLTPGRDVPVRVTWQVAGLCRELSASGIVPWPSTQNQPPK